MKALALALLVSLPLISGCLGSGSPFAVVVSSPVLANGMTILVANAGGLLGPVDGRATYLVRYNGEIVYPPGGIGGTIDLVQGKGSTFIPYQLFVVGNGNYDVAVDLNGAAVSQTAKITKWVSNVFLQVYCDQSKRCDYAPGERIQVDAVLEQSPGFPNARVVASGTLNIDVRYRGEAKQSDGIVHALSVELPGEQSFARVDIPFSKFNVRKGWYSVDATFHNEQALGNTWVENDPSMGSSNPPANWVHVDR